MYPIFMTQILILVAQLRAVPLENLTPTDIHHDVYS